MLDTRQYRTDQACGDGLQLCPERLEPERTMLGAEQEEWLFNGFRGSSARWDVLGQQVFFSQYDYIPGEVDKFLLDAWDGYVADRDRVVAGLADVRNPIVLTGDVHAAWGAEVKQRWDDPSSPTLGDRTGHHVDHGRWRRVGGVRRDTAVAAREPAREVLQQPARVHVDAVHAR